MNHFLKILVMNASMSKNKKIIFFGDSLTAGYGLRQPQNEAIPALLAANIHVAGFNYVVVNAGISGDTSRSALSRLSSVLQGDVAGFILELGANDFLRGHAPAEVSANLQTIINQVRKAYPAAWILLLGIELPAWAQAFQGSGYANIFRELATVNKIFLVPSFLKGVTGNRSLNMIDGVHPLASGYIKAAENIWPTLLAILQNDSLKG